MINSRLDKSNIHSNTCFSLQRKRKKENELKKNVYKRSLRILFESFWEIDDRYESDRKRRSELWNKLSSSADCFFLQYNNPPKIPIKTITLTIGTDINNAKLGREDNTQRDSISRRLYKPSEHSVPSQLHLPVKRLHVEHPHSYEQSGP